MSQFRIWKANNNADYNTWNQLITQHFKNEPMLKASYYKLFSDSESSGMAAFYECNEGMIIYPFMKRVVPKLTGYFDIISAYGYGGPHSSPGITSEHWSDFWEIFDNWCRQNSIISEVIKFGLFGNENCCYPGKIETIMNNIVRPLDLSMEELFKDYEHKVRKNVKRAEKYELSFTSETNRESIEKFLKIYYDTMDRRSADRMYYFERDFFEFINLEMKNNSCTFFVYYKEKPISTELVLISDENIYSYLGGTYPDYFEMRPNDYLKAKIIEWGNKNGYKNFILGGGHGSEDGIYHYKKSFAPNGIKEFKIGSRILDFEQYRQACAKNGADSENDFIPAYRKK